MPGISTDHLFQLIKTLSKSEKRSFKLYVSRNQSPEDLKFIQLFDVLDKQSDYNEPQLFKKIPGIKKEQLSNLKAHLYKQLLTSLRLLHKQRNADIDIREHIDYARVLYNKGLYLQSLRILDKAKGMARLTHEYLLLLEIIEFEKLIESRHITRSLENRADELAAEARRLNHQIQQTNQLSNLALRLYGLYLKVGHARNEKDYFMIREFFDSNLPDIADSQLGFFEKVYLFQSYCWYNYIVQDLLMYYRYAQKWVGLFETEPHMQQNDPTLYMKGMHNLLTALFTLMSYERFCLALNDLEQFVASRYEDFDENARTLSFLYLSTARLNKHFIEGSFSEGIKLIPELEKQISHYELTLDQHRVLVFYYKIACLYFGNGEFGNAIDYLNKIINLKVGNLRSDIQCFARILHLISHYELRHYNLFEYLIKSVYRFLIKNEDMSQMIGEILKFLRKNLNERPQDLKPAFAQLKNRLEISAQNPYEKRNFLYLDIVSWLESKIENQPVQKVMQEKFKNRSQPNTNPPA